MLRIAILSAAAAALELTKWNFDEVTANKAVFVNFYSSTCSKSRNFKPQWDNLMHEFQDDGHGVVAEVDCDGSGKELCKDNYVKQYPGIKFGTTHDLRDYTGSRDLEALKKFADENFKPLCSVGNIDDCDEEMKMQIEIFKSMESEELRELVKAREDTIVKYGEISQNVADDLEKKIAEAKAEMADESHQDAEFQLGYMHVLKGLQNDLQLVWKALESEAQKQKNIGLTAMKMVVNHREEL